ncbi:hypothetical protein SOPP22_07925 [Shewanella sp. OPT22]|nr:hypothetical protein SOPP22_07925 [Shewanella sp. OPT22]
MATAIGIPPQTSAVHAETNCLSKFQGNTVDLGNKCFRVRYDSSTSDCSLDPSSKNKAFKIILQLFHMVQRAFLLEPSTHFLCQSASNEKATVQSTERAFAVLSKHNQITEVTKSTVEDETLSKYNCPITGKPLTSEQAIGIDISSGKSTDSQPQLVSREGLNLILFKSFMDRSSVSLKVPADFKVTKEDILEGRARLHNITSRDLISICGAQQETSSSFDEGFGGSETSSELDTTSTQSFESVFSTNDVLEESPPSLPRPEPQSEIQPAEFFEGSEEVMKIHEKLFNVCQVKTNHFYHLREGKSLRRCPITDQLLDTMSAVFFCYEGKRMLISREGALQAMMGFQFNPNDEVVKRYPFTVMQLQNGVFKEV